MVEANADKFASPICHLSSGDQCSSPQHAGTALRALSILIQIGRVFQKTGATNQRTFWPFQEDLCRIRKYNIPCQ
jgi:hypothetical protein